MTFGRAAFNSDKASTETMRWEFESVFLDDGVIGNADQVADFSRARGDETGRQIDADAVVAGDRIADFEIQPTGAMTLTAADYGL